MDATLIQHIASKPGVCGGKPCIAGTRIRVLDIYVWHVLEGQTAEGIVADFPQLSMADVYAALTYYWDNREAIERSLKDEEDAYQQLKRSHASPLREKLRQMGVDPASIPP